MTRRAALGSALALGVASTAGAAPSSRPAPLVFAHRGASALRPEHTLAAYAKAIQDGADFIEPDLVPTRDGVLVARHENNIAETTDVADRPEFAPRRTTKTIDGEAQTGWFTEDFTLAELKTLRARERLGAIRPESQRYDGHFQIVTLDEVIDFAAAEAAARGRTIGIVPELKHSTYFAGVGLAVEDRFLAVLAAHAYTRAAPVQVQSFEVANLRYLRGKLPKGGNVRLVQLIGDPAQRPADVVKAGSGPDYRAMVSPAGLREMARYADIVAPNTRMLIPLGADGRLAAPTTLVADAHAAGLQVCPWTFRPENRFLAADFRSDAGDDARNPAGSVAEMRRYIALGIDAFFTDDPALGRLAVDGDR
ncbi:glycerophosphodiester phosphodiesterase [Sphingomonas sp. BE138]|uniref:glycerophosphodiester phosphodiesterase n=1 Tax=Sphingomonas sp. BE138 TaxID=2817845 RepID=UPI00286AA9EE|nr:glycerophosphodiester phosphodiesterase [Sphingomonas sp. BE138]